MRIHFSPNSQSINFAVSLEPGAKTNYTFPEITSQFINGKGIFTFDSEPNKNTFIYLTIFHKNKQKAESEKTTNYVLSERKNTPVRTFSQTTSFSLLEKQCLHLVAQLLVLLLPMSWET